MTNETNETNVQTFPVLSLTHGETLKQTGMNGTNGSMLAALT
jgi:hypothetical protein